jgi:hypothetical protein
MDGFLFSVVQANDEDGGDAQYQHWQLAPLAAVGLLVEAGQQVTEGNVKKACGRNGQGMGNEALHVGQHEVAKQGARQGGEGG